MKRSVATALIALAVAGCAQQRVASADRAPVSVKIIAFNDFHGNLEPPRQAVDAPGPGGATLRVPAGGAAYFASAVAKLKQAADYSVVVAAGDLTSASPLISSIFLDEPTVAAMGMIGLEINAAGNHEFDRGTDELLRLQNGGCKTSAKLKPCEVEPFRGARYTYLAGNTVRADGSTLLPGTTLRRFGKGKRQVTIGFIGLTTQLTGTFVDPHGIKGFHFADEADTANRLARQLKAQGADAIVMLVHEGGKPATGGQPEGCDRLSGRIVDIAARLDPGIDVIVSGHTHRAYICDQGEGNPAKPMLLTSAGNNGVMLTDITLAIDPAAGKVVGRRANQVIVQSEAFTEKGVLVPLTDAYPRFAPDAAVAAHVERYRLAAEPLAKRVVGRASAVIVDDEDHTRESPLGLLIADTQLAATQDAGAQIALMNPGGVRASINPAADGTVTFGDLFAVQPFGNNLMVKEMSGAQIRKVLEQQFTRKSGTAVLYVAGLSYSYDRSKQAGQQIIAPVVGGAPMRDDATYRVTMNSFLAGGGDEFTAFTEGRDVSGGMLDLDALEAWFARGQVVTPPALGRVKDVTPR